jgi:hypothetical protein
MVDFEVEKVPFNEASISKELNFIPIAEKAGKVVKFYCPTIDAICPNTFSSKKRQIWST